MNAVIRWVRVLCYVLWVTNTLTLCWWFHHFKAPWVTYAMAISTGFLGTSLTYGWSRPEGTEP